MNAIDISAIHGVQVGQATDALHGTGCTVILCPQGACAGVDVRGGGPATRETDLLDPRNMVQKIHGIMLSGGSAFGLDAAAGAMGWKKTDAASLLPISMCPSSAAHPCSTFVSAMEACGQMRPWVMKPARPASADCSWKGTTAQEQAPA